MFNAVLLPAILWPRQSYAEAIGEREETGGNWFRTRVKN